MKLDPDILLLFVCKSYVFTAFWCIFIQFCKAKVKMVTSTMNKIQTSTI